MRCFVWMQAPPQQLQLLLCHVAACSAAMSNGCLQNVERGRRSPCSVRWHTLLLDGLLKHFCEHYAVQSCPSMGGPQRKSRGVIAGATCSDILHGGLQSDIGPPAEKLALLLQGQFLQQAATTIGLPDLSPGAAPTSLLAPSSPLVPHQQLVVSAYIIAACPTSSFGNPKANGRPGTEADGIGPPGVLLQSHEEVVQ